MRIITGSARGVQLASLEGEATRPTADRVKEALFSMIQFDVEGRRVLDLFAGSGQLGLEALSRGADSCVMTDGAKAAVDVVIANAKKAKLFDKCRISVCDYAMFLKGAAEREQFGLVFLDPPYASGYVAQALELIAAGDMLSDGGKIVCETDNGQLPKNKKEIKSDEYNNKKVLEQVFSGDGELSAKYSVIRTALYGRVRITVLEKA